MPCRVPILSPGQFPVVYHLFLLLIDPDNSFSKNEKNEKQHIKCHMQSQPQDHILNN